MKRKKKKKPRWQSSVPKSPGGLCGEVNEVWCWKKQKPMRSEVNVNKQTRGVEE